jgi:CheY-like chemotaxis protein
LETYNLKPIDLNEVIEETIRLLEHTLQKSVEIETHLMLDLPLVDADSGRIQQVFLNLCVNARDAMPRGGIISIKSNVQIVNDSFYDKPHDLPDGKYVRISISDTGTGMDEETKSKIFEPFFTTKQQGKGTGLGLAIVYGVIQNHKGFITVDSKIDHGTIFHLYLPVSILTQKEAIELKSEQIIGGTETILIIDDEEIVLDIVKDILTNLNYRVIAVNNGTAALELYKVNKDQISVVLLDLAMPKMNGEETFINLKKINPGVKVLVASGLVDTDTRKRMEKNGVLGFINKPYHIEMVAKSIRNIIDQR